MIHLLDNRERILRTINDADIYVNEERLRLTDENYVSYILSVEMKYIPISITNAATYAMVGLDSDYQAYFINKIQTENNNTIITGVSAIIERLQKTVVPQLAGKKTLRVALTQTLAQTGIQLVIDEDIASKTITSDLNQVIAWEAVKELSFYYGFEMDMKVKYSVDGNEQTDPYVQQLVVKSVLGEDKPEEAVIYGHNAKSFSSENDRTNRITALKGFGKVITDTEALKKWKTDSEQRLKALHGRNWKLFQPSVEYDEDNPPKYDFTPVYASDKPYGQDYISIAPDSALMKAFGIYDRATDTFKHKFNTIDFPDLEHPIDILNATRQELHSRLREEVFYQVRAEGLDVNVGDTIRAGTTDVLADDAVIKARVIEFVRDNITGRNVEISIGDHLTKSNNRKRRDLNNDIGVAPLTSSPTISTYPIKGIDGLINGTLPKLSDFGDWDIDEFGKTGLDYNTLDKGFNNPDGMIVVPPVEEPEIPVDPNPPGEWVPDIPDYPGVIAEFVIVVPNTINETAILNMGTQAVNYNEVMDEWKNLFSHTGELNMPGPSVSIGNFQGVATEKKTYYRIDGTVAFSPTVHYIIGKPQTIIRDLISESKRAELGLDENDGVLDMTIEELYGGEYGLPEPEDIPYVFDSVNGLNILGENFIIVPANNALTYQAVASIAARSVDLSKYSEETHLVTSVYRYAEARDIAQSGGTSVGVSEIHMNIHHRHKGPIGETRVVVIHGPLASLATDAKNFMSTWVGADYEPYITYYKGSLIPKDMTIGDIYKELENTYK